MHPVSPDSWTWSQGLPISMNSSSSQQSLDKHYDMVVRVIREGQIVPFLGDQINMCGRLRNEKGDLENWRNGNNTPNYSPTNVELALHLNKIFDCEYRRGIVCRLCENIEHSPTGCPIKPGLIGLTDKLALQHVSQYLELSDCPDIFNGILYELFDAEYSPNPLHQFLANLPRIMRVKGYCPPHQLIVTTCFDRSLERAFKEAGEPFDLVSFINDQDGSKFLHQRFIREPLSQGEVHIIEEDEPRPIDNPNEYDCLSLDKCPIILKLYGGIERFMGRGENFVITEDHCIDYLVDKNVAALLPITLLNKLHNSNILFLGYRPSYWNLRVILHRIWSETLSQRNNPWWAIQPTPEILDREFWKRYTRREPIKISLDDYIAELNKRVQELPAKKEFSPLPPTQQPDKVFISYSHKDKVWLEKLKKMLSPAIKKEEKLLVWDDTEIKLGAKWREEIKKAVETAKVAVLLVSDNFLDSDFIIREELPLLVKAVEKNGLKIAWFTLSKCDYTCSDIADYQAAHDPCKPLDSLCEPEQKTVLVKISKKILAAATAWNRDRSPPRAIIIDTP